jgi:ABC-type transport system involved in multi-copper enzyme maturation permease subunit
MRWGLGPVFIYECLANSRRWQTYALRSVGDAVLLFAMGTIATSRIRTMGNSARDYANLGQAYFVAMIGVELALVLLAAPAATAGAICVDRARGTLAHMLMTDLSDPEIVLGKLAARLLPVFGLVACSWPVMAISSLLGGIDPIALTLAFAIIVAVAVLGCTMALALSVWARKTHEVILATYTVFILGVLFWPIWYFLSMAGWVGAPPPWALLPNPFYVAFAPYAVPGKLDFWDYLVFFGVALLASALLILLAVWRTRPVACRGSVEKSRGPRIGLIGRMTRWLPGPSLDRNPVLWREWHRSRPSRWMTAILALLMGTTGALCLVGAVAFWKNGADVVGARAATWEMAGVFSYILHLIFGLLMLAAIAPTSMAEERQRGSLDILAATAISTRAIVIGKWLGTFRLVVLMCLGPGLMALAMATARSKATFGPGPGFPADFYRMITFGSRCYGVLVVIATIIAHGALITSVGLAMAVWIKRQSRAIAISVGSFVLVAAAWPFVVSSPTYSEWRRNLASLSPVVVCLVFVNFFTSRSHGFFGGVLWSCTLWALEVFALAMGLLWLTVCTFDGCFDRVPDRPRRISIRTVVVMILAGMMGAGSLVGAIDIWIEGVKLGSISGPTSVGITAYFLLIAIGLLIIAVESAKSGRPAWKVVAATAPGLAARSFVLGRWWKSFRLVLLLAIGPALLAMALATAHKAPRYEEHFTTDSMGNKIIDSYVLAKADHPYVAEARLGQRLLIAAQLIVTILVHGGAAISVGLGLTTANGWSRRAIATVVGLAFLAVFILQPAYSLLALLVSRTSFSIGETLSSMIIWDIVVAVFAIGLSRWTIWAWQLDSDLNDGQPTVSTVLVGD